MTLTILHNLSAIFFVVCLAGKLVLHGYLDNRHQKDYGFLYALSAPLAFLLSYRKAVKEKYKTTRAICNASLYLAACMLTANLAIGMAMYFVLK